MERISGGQGDKSHPSLRGTDSVPGSAPITLHRLYNSSQGSPHHRFHFTGEETETWRESEQLAEGHVAASGSAET